ncbi:hypothetical protein MRS44_003409 [Fusarium solani]|uniref:uncharacterized protein n=1 Tax=Fusarium solani TaxID=169388 RepID=UPI0032C44984|nr:hypothetical protein MRS44_003409 [Fusarium solani]
MISVIIFPEASRHKKSPPLIHNPHLAAPPIPVLKASGQLEARWGVLGSNSHSLRGGVILDERSLCNLPTADDFELVVTGKYPVIKCTELAKPRLGF